MSFVTPVFFLFFLITFTVCALAGPRLKYVALFGAGCFFYAHAGLRSLAVLGAVTLWTYVGGLVLDRALHSKTRRLFPGPDLIYWIFFLGNLTALAICKIGNLIGHRGGVISILLPVGMSFYVFQTCWYLSDIYRRGLGAEKNPVTYAAFAMFFPSLLSGPILKPRQILPQIQTPGTPDGESMIHGFLLFLWGLFVKLFVANRLTPAVDYIYQQAGYFTGIYYLTAAILFSLQLYADFSSYSDMAIGLAAMLGIRVPANFRNPFLSVSMAELWNRWHISLNDWFIENVYIPLGGSRKGKVRRYVNELAIFLFSGFWHGQGFHFVIWGLYNGLVMILGQLTEGFRKKGRAALHLDKNPVLTWIRRLLVFLIFTMTFIFFRADSTDLALMMTRGILGIRPGDLAGFYPQQLFGKSTPAFLTAAGLTAFWLLVSYLRSREGAEGKGGEVAEADKGCFARLPLPLKAGIAVLLLTACILNMCQASTTLNTSFVYYAF